MTTILQNITSSSTPLSLVPSTFNVYNITGTVAQTIILPNAVQLLNGFEFTILNNTTQIITIQDNATTVLNYLIPKCHAYIILTSNSTSAGSWELVFFNDRTRNEVVAVQTATPTPTIQAIPDSTVTQLTLYDRIIRDDLGQYNISTKTFTAATTGNYNVTCGLHMSDIDSGGVTRAGVRQLTLYRNGTFFIVLNRVTAIPAFTGDSIIVGASTLRLTRGDTLTFHIFQNSGGFLNTFNDSFLNNITITKLNN